MLTLISIPGPESQQIYSAGGRTRPEKQVHLCSKSFKMIEVHVRNPTMSCDTSKHVILVGVIGVGKSTLGPILAEEMSRAWFDVDTEIDKRSSESGGEIIRKLGIPKFREIEEHACSDLIKSEPGAVISTGAGAFLSESTRARCRAHTVVWLRNDPQRIAGRVQHSDRYLIRNHCALTVVTEQLESRASCYKEADLWVECGDAAPRDLAGAILPYLS